jgi:type IV secretion system protein VirB11
MLKAWNTGQPGGIATIHATGVRAALYRIEQLVQEAVPVLPRSLIADAIDLIVFIDGQGTDRRIDALAALAGVAADGDYILEPIAFDQNEEGPVGNA